MKTELESQSQMYELSWTNRFGEVKSLTHLFENEVYAWGEAFINEGKDITICPMN